MENQARCNNRTGVAHGGSLVLSVSILELIGKGEVIGIDIDIREHNRIKIRPTSTEKAY